MDNRPAKVFKKDKLNYDQHILQEKLEIKHPHQFESQRDRPYFEDDKRSNFVGTQKNEKSL